MGIEPTRPKDTWPSTMPVYQFQHPGVLKNGMTNIRRYFDLQLKMETMTTLYSDNAWVISINLVLCWIPNAEKIDLIWFFTD